MFAHLIAQGLPDPEILSSLGAAGLMGFLWLWERSQSRKRDEQLTEAHNRILADKILVDELVRLSVKNTQVLERLVNRIDDFMEATRHGRD